MKNQIENPNKVKELVKSDLPKFKKWKADTEVIIKMIKKAKKELTGKGEFAAYLDGIGMNRMTAHRYVKAQFNNDGTFDLSIGRPKKKVEKSESDNDESEPEKSVSKPTAKKAKNGMERLEALQNYLVSIGYKNARKLTAQQAIELQSKIFQAINHKVLVDTK